MVRTQDNAERFWTQVDATGDCWEWTGHRYTVWKYGRFRVRIAGRQVDRYAHRTAWELLVGPIRKGLVLDHLCRVPWCVNPDHLQPVTDRINVVLRGYSPSAIAYRRKVA